MIGNIITETQYMFIDDIKVLDKYLYRQILVISAELTFSGEHAMCGALHMPIGRNNYYSTNEIITFEENYSMCRMPIR